MRPAMGQFHHFMMEWLPNLAFLLASVPVERLLRANALSAAASLSAAAAGLPAGAGPHEQWPELVFIDRLDAPRSATKRALTNAAELGAALQRRGFAQLSIADLSFSARARKLSDAKLVVMLAGTTQANSLFVPPGARIIIVVAHPFGFSDKWNCAWYSWLCSPSACDVLFLNNTLPDYRRARAMEPWRIDCTADLQPLCSRSSTP